MGVMEVENTFEATPDTPLPVLTDLTYGPSTTHHLHAEYFDTPDFALARGRTATVRRREGGTDAGWHVKRVRGPGKREEYRLPLGPETLPPELRSKVEDLIGSAALAPVVTLSTVRVETDLVGVDGDLQGYLCRDDVLARYGDRTAQWCEWEIESSQADTSWLRTVSDQFVRAGIPLSSYPSKYGRALHTLVPSSPSPVTASSVIRDYVNAQIGMIQSCEAGVLIDSPDTVHRSRVAVRRLRSAVALFGDYYPVSVEMQHDLAWYARVLGAARDAEVLVELFSSAVPSNTQTTGRSGSLVRLQAQVATQHVVAHRALVEAMSTRRYRFLISSLTSLVVTATVTQQGSDPAENLIPIVVDAARRVVDMADGLVVRREHFPQWHDVRKAAKRVRYGFDALSTVTQPVIAEQAQLWEAVTESLGKVQDCHLAQGAVDDVRRSLSAAGVDDYAPITAELTATALTQLESAQQALQAAASALPHT